MNRYIILGISFNSKMSYPLDLDEGTEEDYNDLAGQLEMLYTGTTWEADDPEDLVEIISTASGWLVSNIVWEVEK